MKTTLILSLLASALCVMAAEKPIFKFAMNEGQGNVIKSTGSAAVTAKILNKDYEWGPGRTGGKALYFKNPANGKSRSNACAVLAPGQYVDFTKPFTVMFWVKPDKDTSGSIQYTIISNVKSDYGPGWRLMYGWGSLRLSTGLGNKKTYVNLPVPTNKFPHAKDVWHHFSFTYDGKVCRLYLNGIKTAEKEFVLGAGSSTLTIGAYSSGSAYGFRGALSDISIYSKAFSAEEILKEAQGIK